MTNEKPLTLMIPFTQGLAFKVIRFEDPDLFTSLNSFNYFSVILLLQTSGELRAGTTTAAFTGNNLMTFSLYEQFAIRCDRSVQGWIVNFHPDFFCLHQHRNEVSCNGILFNNIYDSPLTALSLDYALSLKTVIESMEKEVQQPAGPDTEVLLAYLKILLISGSRIKMENNEKEKSANDSIAAGNTSLTEAIEHHFRKLHRPADYAKLLHVTPTVLNRMSKKSFDKTFSGLVTERIIVEAKRQLYLTAKPVKLIAFELGFNDEFYFSRYFKTHVKVSPQRFRDTVGFDKANR